MCRDLTGRKNIGHSNRFGAPFHRHEIALRKQRSERGAIGQPGEWVVVGAMRRGLEVACGTLPVGDAQDGLPAVGPGGDVDRACSQRTVVKAAAVGVAESIGELAVAGLAVLLITSDLPEMVALADRVVVMRAFRVQGEVANDAHEYDPTSRAVMSLIHA